MRFFVIFWVRNLWAENGSMLVSFKCLTPLCVHFLGQESEPATARDFKAPGDEKITVLCKFWWLSMTSTGLLAIGMTSTRGRQGERRERVAGGRKDVAEDKRRGMLRNAALEATLTT